MMLHIHQPPIEETTCCDSDVSINGEKTSPYFARVSAIPYNTVRPGRQRPENQTESASFISFEADGPAHIERLLTEQYLNADKVVFVMDNLNTHGIASLYPVINI